MSESEPRREVNVRRFTIRELASRADELGTLRQRGGSLSRHMEELYARLSANPAGRPGDLALIFTTDGDEVVGTLGLIGGRFWRDGKEERLFWLSAFFLDERYRTTGAGGMMLLAALAFSRHLLATGGPAPETQKLYQAAGFIETARLQRFVAFRSGGVLAARALGEGHVARAAGALATPALRLGYGALALGARAVALRSRLTFTPVDRLPDELDRVLEGAKNEPFRRLAKDLDWVLDHRPLLRPYLVRRGALLVGYVLMKVADQAAGGGPHRLPRMRIASLWDYMITGMSHADRAALILHCRDFARESGAEVLECQVGDPEMAALLRRSGFVHLGGKRTFYRPPRPIKGELAPGWHAAHGLADSIFD